MTLPRIPYAEFYITNVCNLACDNCNRFNNLDFRGRFDWNPALYRPWAERVQIDRLAILGGEPTYHPGLIDWIQGLTELWPKTFKMLITNGTRLGYPGLHSALAAGGWELEINLHREKESEFSQRIIQDLHEHFGPLEFVEEGCWGRPGLTYRSRQGVTVFLRNKWIFHRSAIENYDRLATFDSDPVRAHALCTMRTCHHFIEGALYKCGVARLLPDLLRQKGRSVPEWMEAYRPLRAEEATQQSLDRLAQTPIETCRACSDRREDWQSHPFETLLKRDIDR